MENRNREDLDKEILRWLAGGMGLREAGRKAGVSLSTVKAIVRKGPPSRTVKCPATELMKILQDRMQQLLDEMQVLGIMIDLEARGLVESFMVLAPMVENSFTINDIADFVFKATTKDADGNPIYEPNMSYSIPMPEKYPPYRAASFISKELLSLCEEEAAQHLTPPRGV